MAAPSKLGQRLSRNSRWADAYWFAVVAHLVPYAVAAVISVSILCYYMLMGSNTVSVEPTMVALLVLLYVGMAFVAPLLITGLWAGMTHLILLMGGAPRHGFHVTSSALLYGHAPIVFYLLGMVPLVGVFVSLALYVWVMVIASVVLMRAQRVSGWRATLAVVLPPIVLIGGCLGLLIMSMI